MAAHTPPAAPRVAGVPPGPAAAAAPCGRSGRRTSGPTAPQASTWRLLYRLCALAWRYRGRCLLVLSEQTLIMALHVGILAVTGLAIDWIRFRALGGGDPPRWPFGWSPAEGSSAMALVGLLGVAILAMSVLHAVTRRVVMMTASHLVQEIVIDLRSAVYDRFQRLSFRYLDAVTSGSLIQRVAGDVQSVRMFVDAVLIQILLVVLALMLYLFYMLRIHVPLTLACLATTPVLWVAAVLFSRKVRPQYVRHAELVDRLLLTLSENVQGMHVVKGFALEDRQVEKFRRRTGEVCGQKQKIFWQVSLFQPFTGLLTQVNMVVLLGYGGYLVARGEIRLGEGLFVFANLLQQFANQVGQVTNIANSIQQSLVGAQRVFEVLDTPLEVCDPEQPARWGRARGAIRLEGVWFNYEQDKPVVQDVSFAVQPGQCVALVGATGSGKTTLLSLIPRFYDVAAGRLLIDGVDVRQWKLDDLRRNIGIVFQESFLFSNTAAANIAYGWPGAPTSSIEQAARAAAAHEFLDQLPQGYDTLIGEYGADLSGGQRQRLAIARALVLDPPILLLDDATTAVDAETEDEILGAVESAMRDRTTLVIAHRLSTVRRADRVIVIDEGRVVQQGTHAQLMRQPGHYRETVAMQLEQDEDSRTTVRCERRAV